MTEKLAVVKFFLCSWKNSFQLEVLEDVLDVLRHPFLFVSGMFLDMAVRIVFVTLQDQDFHEVGVIILDLSAYQVFLADLDEDDIGDFVEGLMFPLVLLEFVYQAGYVKASCVDSCYIIFKCFHLGSYGSGTGSA